MPTLLLLCPIRSPLLLLLRPYIIIVMSALVMLWPLRLLYIERRSFHLYHPRIVHLCNVKEVAPSKRLNSKALIYLFYLFLSWFHNSLRHMFLQLMSQHVEPVTWFSFSSQLVQCNHPTLWEGFPAFWDIQLTCKYDQLWYAFCSIFIL